ncbi:MAG TPA: MFS transporter [Candidatus Thermoplasmatota archaeon]|nr:MFS transporter [Candidatus Thermoplasmatota archaeon]
METQRDVPSSPSLAIATAANTLGVTAHSTYMYYLAPLALRAAGIVGKDALLFSLIAVAMGLAVVPAGRLADRVPRRYVLRAGLALLGSSYLALLAPLALGPIVAGVVASGVGLALLFVSFQSYVADLLRDEDRAGAYARSSAWGILATAAGPLAAALVLRASATPVAGLRASALVFLAASAAAIALTLRLPSLAHAPPAAHERGRWHHAVRAAAPIALMYVLMGAGYGMTAPYFTTWFLDDLGMPGPAWGYLLAAGTLASAAGAILAGTLSRRLPTPPVAVAGMVAMLVASVAFALPLATFAFAAAFLARSFFSTTVAPGMNAIVMTRAKSGRRAETQAYGSLAWNAGWATGGALGGTLLATLGGRSFVLGAALALAGVVTGVTLLRMRASD